MKIGYTIAEPQGDGNYLFVVKGNRKVLFFDEEEAHKMLEDVKVTIPNAAVLKFDISDWRVVVKEDVC